MRRTISYMKNRIINENMLSYLEHEGIYKLNLPTRERNIDIVRSICSDNATYSVMAAKYNITSVRVRQILSDYIIAVSRAKSNRLIK